VQVLDAADLRQHFIDAVKAAAARAAALGDEYGKD
jgi:hypothetical protein